MWLVWHMRQAGRSQMPSGPETGPDGRCGLSAERSLTPAASTSHRNESVSDGEIRTSRTERVWFTVPVTSGRIIIGWRVGT